MKNKTLQEIYAHAIRDFPREACGLVVVNGRKEFYFPCRNIAAEQDEDFTIHPEDVVEAETLGNVTMLAHSHPNGSPSPSESDRVGCEGSGLPWLIVAVHADPAAPGEPPRVVADRVLEPNGYELPLRGRTFKFGIVDCYTLVRDYYSREMGITLPDFQRTDKFWERGEDLYMENLAASGFDLIDEPSQKGDLILMAIRSDIVNHCAIWLDERGAMLHHPYEHLSERVVYGGFWAENTRAFARKVR